MSESAQPFSILMVNYKTRQMTSLCLELLKTHIDTQRVEVVVVDNGSDDESVEYLRSLDWITLVRRRQTKGEAAFISHGEALDEGLKHVKNRYVCLLHTDTFIHDPQVFELLLTKIRRKGVAAVGSLHQRHRGLHRRLFRSCKKATRYYFRKLLYLLGINSSTPKPFRDIYLKSFCCMWDVDLIRSEKLQFCAEDKNPGYFMQDELTRRGFEFTNLKTRILFDYLDHVQSGTVVELEKIECNLRRAREYDRVLKLVSTGV